MRVEWAVYDQLTINEGGTGLLAVYDQLTINEGGMGCVWSIDN